MSTATQPIDPSSGDEGFQGRALEVLADARERVSKAGGKIRDYISNEPARALALALGMGVLLGWLIKRR